MDNGNQHLALTDTFGRNHTYLRISLTERCNLRCTYCMPADGVPLSPKAEILTFDELELLARHFVDLGIDKIRFTGGEPLVRKDATDVINRISAIPGLKSVAITTNGLLLQRCLPALEEAGVDTINISLDTLQADRFEKITRRRGLDKTIEAIDLALQSSIQNVKINCVVMKGVNDDEVLDFCELTSSRGLEMRFIEYMPFSGNEWSDAKFIPYRTLLEDVSKRYPDLEARSSPATSTAKNFRIPGYKGSIGFITSMSEHFCGGCNRLRLTADGNLKVCLFGKAEVSLRDAIRSGATKEQLTQIIVSSVKRKKFSHDGMYTIASSENRPMILIGG